MLLAKEKMVKEFQKLVEPNYPLMVVQICKNISEFGYKTDIKGGSDDVETALDKIHFSMVYLSSRDHTREEIYSLSNIDACIDKFDGIEESSPSGLYYFVSEKNKILSAGDLSIKMNFLAWIGTKNG